MTENKRCPACSKDVDREDIFCRYCGDYFGTEPVEKYICNKCGHLSYFDFVQDPNNPNIEKCLKCKEGLLWLKKKKESKDL